jgi:2-oxoglutarate ferredoxin oxidoreductase subunit delta
MAHGSGGSDRAAGGGRKAAASDAVRRAWHYPGRDEHPDVDIFVYDQWCKRCGICAAMCPAGVFESDEAGRPVLANPDACIACYLCEKLCPDMAITVYKERKSAGRDGKGGSGKGRGADRAEGGHESG